MGCPAVADLKQLFQAYTLADDALQAELVKTYGKAAGDARYDPTKVGATPELRKLVREYAEARTAWLRRSDAMMYANPMPLH